MSEIEVRVRQKGKPYLRVRLRQSPATIGRDPEADVFLDSTMVSRVHARLFFDEANIRIVDAGSTNGIRVDGVQHARADLEPTHTVTICDFAIRARPVTAAEEEASEALAEGWVEDDEEDDEEDEDTNAGQKAPNTHVGEAPLPPEGSLPSLSLRPEDVVREASAREASYREPSYRPDTEADAEADGLAGERADTNVGAEASYDPGDEPFIEDPDVDPDELDAERIPDDVPAIISVMRNAEAQLETGRINRRGVVIEVLVSVGARLHDVALLKPGETYWWGDEPGFPESLWTVPAVDRFPLVSHRDPGIYDVQVPQDSTWKMFHRGDQRAPTYRSGALVGMRVAARELAEISFGPYTIYVRCVSAPEPLVKPFDLTRFIPKPAAVMASVAALIINVVVLAMPGNHRTFSTNPIPNEEYVVREVGFREKPPEIPVPELTAEIPKDVEVATTKDPELASPTPAAPVDEPVLDAPPVPIKPQKRHKPDPNAGVTTIQSAPTPKQVSIGDFRVSGLLNGVPEPMIEKGKGPPVSGPGAALRSGKSEGNTQSVDKSGYPGVNITPGGRLDQTEVKLGVNRGARDLSRCQQEEPDIAGRLDLQWVVEESGAVRQGSVRVVTDELRSNEMTKCVRAAVAKWTFAQPKGGPATVTFPFRFQPRT